ncbi:hypothetical protein FLM48_06625 [Shewanella sp. Scap07]|uniref:hypothetical protein n=1 Tax=Shewanella sp. Scap07 TaxID=2589987 RepID=UPI0015BD279F|nr:hypothetical protein [Shewanella sp. Scap07]QLE84786.1 hypothetical protein FLM48_06625 [Shewanella sp. Scap07]
MMALLKAFYRGFVGGPDFNNTITRKFILEDKQLSVTMPDSNVAAIDNAKDVSFPHTSSIWFKQNAKVYMQHHYVRVMTENWMYVPPVGVGTSSEYGMLSCQVRIKQTSAINVLDKTALAQFVVQAYDNFHNGPEGRNTEIRQETIEETSQMARSFTPDELEEEIAELIHLRGKPAIPAAKLIEINGVDWVFYQEVKNNRRSHLDFYCLPLSPTSFLEVKFNHRVDRSDQHKKWAKHALESQQRIMEAILLTNIPASDDNLVAHNAEVV